MCNILLVDLVDLVDIDLNKFGYYLGVMWKTNGQILHFYISGSIPSKFLSEDILRLLNHKHASV